VILLVIKLAFKGNLYRYNSAQFISAGSGGYKRRKLLTAAAAAGLCTLESS
jgi:hypothetical protein